MTEPTECTRCLADLTDFKTVFEGESGHVYCSELCFESSEPGLNPPKIVAPPKTGYDDPTIIGDCAYCVAPLYEGRELFHAPTGTASYCSIVCRAHHYPDPIEPPLAKRTIYEPDTITLFSGEETFSPIQFNSFKMPTIIYKTTVGPFETPESALERASKFVQNAKKDCYMQSRDFFWKGYNNRAENNPRHKVFDEPLNDEYIPY